MKPILIVTVVSAVILGYVFIRTSGKHKPDTVPEKPAYWFVLERRSNREKLYFGKPGDAENSRLVKTFKVKSGMPGEKPTPLPELAGRKYWRITGELDSSDNPETAPFFLILDVPVPEGPPFGPVPYLECGGQCDWAVPGYFGLHGVNGDGKKLSSGDPGSSGCIRHSDGDITYLYNLLDPGKTEIRYYVRDV